MGRLKRGMRGRPGTRASPWDHRAVPAVPARAACALAGELGPDTQEADRPAAAELAERREGGLLDRRVKNGTYRTFTTTRLAGRCSAAMSAATSRASRTTSARTASQSPMSCWKVVSRPCERATYGALSTGDGLSPRAVWTSHGPVTGPKCGARANGSAAASSATVPMPSPASLAAVLRPMPHSASVGSPPSTSNHEPCVSRNIPAGLPYPVASLAWSLFSPMPTVQSSWLAARTCSWIRRATSSGSSVSTARNASSQPIASTTASNSRRAAMTVADTAS